MNILHIIPYYKPAYIYGGPIVSCSRLVEQLNILNQNVAVWTTTANGNQLLDIEPNTEKNIDGVAICYFNLVGNTRYFFSPKLLSDLYQKGNTFDIIHIHTWWNLTAVFAALICLTKGITPVFSPRGMLSPFSFENRKSSIKGLFHKLLGKRLLRNTRLHATAKQEWIECQVIIPDWQGFTAPNIIDLNSSPQSLLINQETVFRLIFLSRIHPKKGIHLLMRSLAKLQFEWSFYIVGTGDEEYLKELKDLAKNLEIDKHITWTNWVDGQEKYQYFTSSDLMVLPSLNENFANTVLESLSVGTPVFVSNQVGLCDYVEENDFGWVVELNTESMTKALNDAYQKKGKRQRIRQDAPQKIRKDFAPESVARQYITVYESILHSNKQF